MKRNKLDALLIPTSIADTATYDPFAVNTWIAPISSNFGFQSITFPIGYRLSDQMPIGIDLISKQFKEEELIKMGFTFEKSLASKLLPKLPEANMEIMNLTIPQLNNLITLVGFTTYNFILKSKNKDKIPKSDRVEPEVFRKNYFEQLKKFI